MINKDKKISIVFTYSERQVIYDQALISDKNIESTNLEPLTGHQYGQYLRLARSANPAVFRSVPPDIIWLAQHSGRGDMIPQNIATSSFLEGVLRKKAPQYARLTVAMLARFLRSADRDLNVENIMQTAH